jgi:hypothetical protein
VLVAFHDPRVDRVSDSTGAIAELPWRSVAAARIVGSEPIPRLEELLDAFPAARINIDVKAAPAIGPLVEVIRRTGAWDRVCVASFSDRRLAALRAAAGPRLAPSLGPRSGDDTMFASIHSSSTGGGDAGSLVRRVAAAAGTLGLQDWVVLGDFNRDPTALPALGLPNGSHIYNTGMATQQSGGELDYMVSNVLTQNWQASRGAAHDSDHWPVTFSSLRAGADPTRFTISDHGNSSVLDVYDAQKVNGTHIILYHPDSGTNQLWTLKTAGLCGQFDRLVSAASDKCMDVDNGTASTIGSRMNIWDCHNSSTANDTQEFALEHPVPLFPNLTTVEDTQTGLYLNVSENSNADGTPVIQYTQQYGQLPYPADNESFSFHPAVG